MDTIFRLPLAFSYPAAIRDSLTALSRRPPEGSQLHSTNRPFLTDLGKSSKASNSRTLIRCRLNHKLAQCTHRSPRRRSLQRYGSLCLHDHHRGNDACVNFTPIEGIGKFRRVLVETRRTLARAIIRRDQQPKTNQVGWRQQTLLGCRFRGSLPGNYSGSAGPCPG